MAADTPRSPNPRELLRQALPDAERPAPWRAPTSEELAPGFPEFALAGLIGQGGMAAVYKATQRKLGRLVALKVLRPDFAARPEFVERFLREARALAALNHPHVLTVHDFGERNGLCYLVTEYVDGANLRELMALGQLTPAEVLRIVPQICAGLQFAHEHGVVHRDVKPENVLVDRHGLVKLADFGLAKLATAEGEATLTQASMVFGTPHYMAPEQWRGSGKVDHRADIYSLGVVLYELLTGKLPVGTYELPSRCVPVAAGIDQVVHRSLEQEPARRYQEVSEVKRDVEQVSSAAAPTPPPVPVPAAASYSAASLLVLALVVLVSAAVTLVAFVGTELQHARARESALAGQEHQLALMEDIRATVAAGNAWTGELPKPVSAYGTEGMELRDGVLLGLFWTLGTVVAVSVLGVWSLRLRRSAKAGPAALPVRSRGLPATALAAFLVMLGSLLAALAVPRQPALSLAVPVPTAANSLLGRSPAAVLEVLGPPAKIQSSASGMAWGYLGLGGKVVEQALEFAGGKVVNTRQSAELLVPGRVPERGPYLGQDISQLTRQRGEAASFVGSTGVIELRFPDGLEVHHHHGVVIAFSRG